MIRGLEAINLFSENAKRLAAFYRDKVGLKVTFEGVMGEQDEEVYELALGKGPNLYIMDHSKVHGKNRYPWPKGHGSLIFAQKFASSTR